MSDKKTVIWTSPPKLYRVENSYGVELSWLTDEAIAYLTTRIREGESYTLISSCPELVESMKFLKDSARPKITEEDMQDTKIDLYLVTRREMKSCAT